MDTSIDAEDSVSPLSAPYVGHFQPLSMAGSISSSSPPYCVARNRERYQVGIDYHVPPQATNILREQAWRDTLYCLDRLVDQNIPSYLLNNILLEEKVALRDRSSSKRSDIYDDMLNCMTRCHHGNHSLLIHTGGKYLDDIVLRYASQLLPYNANLEPGFTSNIGTGSAVRDTSVIGYSSWNSSSHLLCRTDHDLIHLKTSDLRDLRLSSHVSRKYHNKLNSYVILEPIQKWMLPSKIVAMSSSRSNWSQSAILSKNGHFHQWLPNQGVISHTGSLLPSQFLESNGDIYDHMKIFASHHPQMYFLTCKDSIFIKDLRSSHRASSVCSFDSSQIKAAVLFPSEPSMHQERYCMVSRSGKSGSMASVIDLRYPNTVLSERPIPHAHTVIKDIGYDNLVPNAADYGLNSLDLLVGASTTSRELCIHTISRQSHDLFNPNAFELLKDNGLATILGALSYSGIRQGSLGWDITANPVVDRNDSRLAGFDVVPYPQGLQSVETNDSSHDSNNIDKPYNALLAQQSETGDVYVQRILVGNTHHASFIRSMQSDGKAHVHAADSDDRPPIQLGLPAGNRCHSVKENSVIKAARAFEGLTLEKSTTIFDQQGSIYPSGKSSFLPFVPEDAMSGFGVYVLDRRLLRSDLPEHILQKLKYLRKRKKAFRTNKISLLADTLPTPPQCNDIIDDNSQMLSRMMPSLLETLESHPLTLWECWRFFFEVYQKAVDMKSLLDYLRRQKSDLDELHLEVQSIQAKARPFDDVRVESNHVNYRQYRKDFKNTKESLSRLFPECGCLNRCLSQSTFLTTHISSSIIDMSIYPCSSKECILVHSIAFAVKSSHRKLFSNDQEPVDRSGRAHQHIVKSDVTVETRRNLMDSWDDMFEEIDV